MKTLYIVYNLCQGFSKEDKPKLNIVGSYFNYEIAVLIARCHNAEIMTSEVNCVSEVMVDTMTELGVAHHYSALLSSQNEMHSKLIAIIDKLDNMTQSIRSDDGLGKYLGDGMPRKNDVALRTAELSAFLKANCFNCFHLLSLSRI